MYKVFTKELPIILTTEKDSFPEQEQFHIKSINLKKIAKKVKKGILVSPVLYAKSEKKLFKHLHTKLPVVVAGGGLVMHENGKLLFIHRNGKWDLPKGKLDDGETIEEAAIREVKEETGAKKLQIVRYIGRTYHIFKWKEETRLKLVHWYLMETSYKGDLKPQHNEGIDKAVWLDTEQVEDVLKDSYANIRDMFPKELLIDVR